VTAGWLGVVRGRSKGRKLRTFTDAEETEGTLIVGWVKRFAVLCPKAILVCGIVRGELQPSMVFVDDGGV
jgi:hypothetical protein